MSELFSSLIFGLVFTVLVVALLVLKIRSDAKRTGDGVGGAAKRRGADDMQKNESGR